jgi:hypothetical protein
MKITALEVFAFMGAALILGAVVELMNHSDWITFFRDLFSHSIPKY